MSLPLRVFNTRAVSWELVKDQIDTRAAKHDCGGTEDGSTFPDAWYPTRLLDFEPLDAATARARLIETA
jgi:hypothetical protein